MSPEQVRGQAVDHRSDIFSFGVVLYEMLTGQRAFRGDSAVETMNAILKEDPAPVAATRRSRCRRRSSGSSCTASRRIPRSASSPPATSPSTSSRCRASPARLSTAAPPPPERRWIRSGGDCGARRGRRRGAVPGRPLDGRTVDRAATFEPTHVQARASSATRGSHPTAGRSSTRRTGKAGRWSSTRRSRAARSRDRSGSEADLQAVSRAGRNGGAARPAGQSAGVLARVPIGGGAPREVLENVTVGRLGSRRGSAGRRADRWRTRHARVSDRPRALPGTRMAQRRGGLAEGRPRRLLRSTPSWSTTAATSRSST